ncbi:uncharacterized protein SCHCODRAFT_01314675 [Schizophyllum commune H4-8]|uniref:uncharacterized protein n=1 Tax=Schizophyllum commune (strain H4-8 / FGSC 9210) TaxID=578458 RepID=UPI0021607270|nr:uncharacterized protein SCHCODRAFT_01314675 [Schizophyllum commune H4-8]KAI5889994.1 hypothetical protein SCHCODRAFT_01314675 [Schizophyllum commune H4-8]
MITRARQRRRRRAQGVTRFRNISIDAFPHAGDGGATAMKNISARGSCARVVNIDGTSDFGEKGWEGCGYLRLGKRNCARAVEIGIAPRRLCECIRPEKVRHCAVVFAEGPCSVDEGVRSEESARGRCATRADEAAGRARWREGWGCPGGLSARGEMLCE